MRQTLSLQYGSEGAGVADVLMAKQNGDFGHDFKGKLSFSWPSSAQQTTVNRFDEDYQPLLPYGYGLTYAKKESLSTQLLNNLPEKSQAVAEALTALKVFDRSVQKPWRENVQSGNKSIDITSNVQKLGAISYRTLDKTVQEDAREIIFDGSEMASINIVGSFPKDLRAYAETPSFLSFTVKIEEKPTSNVYLSMLCEGINNSACKAELDISKIVNNLPEKEWQNVSIDITCFTNAGLDLAKVMAPFQLSTKGRLLLSYADIAISPKTIEQAPELVSMACSSNN